MTLPGTPSPGGKAVAQARTFLGLGSNLGDRRGQLVQALQQLAALPQTRVLRTSSLYETEPWGGIPQPRYLNLVAELRTGLAPEALLEEALAIEASLGRVRTVRWGPRTVDVDLLWMEGARRESEDLTLPHPRLTERAFVLVPLAELAPDLEIQGRRVQAWLDLLGSIQDELWRVEGPLVPRRERSGLDEAVDVKHKDGGSA